MALGTSKIVFGQNQGLGSGATILRALGTFDAGLGTPNASTSVHNVPVETLDVLGACLGFFFNIGGIFFLRNY